MTEKEKLILNYIMDEDLSIKEYILIQEIKIRDFKRRIKEAKNKIKELKQNGKSMSKM
jgi:hypothetical protein